MFKDLIRELRCLFGKLIEAVTALGTAQNTTLVLMEGKCVSVDGGEPMFATPAIIWDDVNQVVIKNVWFDSSNVLIEGEVVVVDYCECLKDLECCPADGEATTFDLRNVDKTDNTKFAFDTPTFDKAHGDAGSSPWTTANLVSELNAAAANATAANNNSGIDYTTTVLAVHPTIADVVVVTAGPVPATLDLVSANISLPVSAI